MNTDAADALEKATLRKVFLRLVPYCFVLYILCYIDRINVGFAALTSLVDFGFKAALKQRLDREQMAAFLGGFNVVSEAIVLALQLFVAGRIVARAGVAEPTGEGVRGRGDAFHLVAGRGPARVTIHGLYVPERERLNHAEIAVYAEWANGVDAARSFLAWHCRAGVPHTVSASVSFLVPTQVSGGFRLRVERQGDHSQSLAPSACHFSTKMGEGVALSRGLYLIGLDSRAAALTSPLEGYAWHVAEGEGNLGCHVAAAFCRRAA